MAAAAAGAGVAAHERAWGGQSDVGCDWTGTQRVAAKFSTEKLADYLLRDSRLVGGQVFHYDLPGMIAFLNAARPVLDAELPDV